MPIAPCIVTGNINTLTGGAIPQGLVIFQLYNVPAGAIPQILGIAEFPNLKIPVLTDQSGAIYTALWGNDVINPSNSQYLVTFRDFLGNEVGPILYSIVGPSFNLNTAIPATGTIPPVYTSTSYASGATVGLGNFALAGWGTGATITNITGVQQRCSITVTCGTGPTVAPTVTFTYPGAYPTSSLSMAQMIGGTGVITDIGVATTTTQAVYTLEDLPQATRTYILVLDTTGN